MAEQKHGICFGDIKMYMLAVFRRVLAFGIHLTKEVA